MDLRQSGFGTYFGQLFVGCFLYADDIALLSASCSGLQKMTDICAQYGKTWDITSNPQKSQAITSTNVILGTVSCIVRNRFLSVGSQYGITACTISKCGIKDAPCGSHFLVPYFS